MVVPHEKCIIILIWLLLWLCVHHLVRAFVVNQITILGHVISICTSCLNKLPIVANVIYKINWPGFLLKFHLLHSCIRHDLLNLLCWIYNSCCRGKIERIVSTAVFNCFLLKVTCTNLKIVPHLQSFFMDIDCSPVDFLYAPWYCSVQLILIL
jgi:hypothetical protein